MISQENEILEDPLASLKAIDLANLTDVACQIGVPNLLYDNFQDVILVVYDLSGVVVTGVAGEAAHGVRHLVYVDAYVPGDQQSVVDLASWD